MKTEIEYSLLEIIESPNRINNMYPDKVIEYMLIACEDISRFKLLVDVLEKHYRWLLVGFALSATDVVDFKTYFSKEFESLNERLKTKTLTQVSSGSISSYFSMILNYFVQGYMYNEKNKRYVIDYMLDVLSGPEINFVLTCLKQVHKEKIFKCFKELYDRNQLSNFLKDFFSFAINRKAEENDQLSTICYAVKDYETYTVLGKVLFKDGVVVDNKEIYLPITEFIEKSSLPALSNRIVYPTVFEVLALPGTHKPFMIRTFMNSFLVDKPAMINDASIVKCLCSGFTTLAFVNNTGNVISLMNSANGKIIEKEVTVTSSKLIKLPMPITGTTVDCLIVKTADEEFTAMIPSDADVSVIKKGSTAKFVFFQDSAYFVA